MPKIAQEHFLLGGMVSYQPNTVPKYPDDSASWTEEQWADFRKRYDIAISRMRKEFKKTKGEIWHHLDEYTHHKDVLQREGFWIKTDIKVWVKAFSKMSTILRYGRHKYDLENNVNIHGDGKGITGYYSKDHCEVFFDEKV
jgi:hypothetical protein